jgi:hypothetical protein
MSDQLQHHGAGAARRAWEPPALKVLTLQADTESACDADLTGGGQQAASREPDAAAPPRHTVKSISPEAFLVGWM